jgi:hypothetical protein
MNKLRKRIDKLKKIQLLLQRKMYSFFHNKHHLFRKKDYLINCHPGNLIETTIYLDKIWEENITKIMSIYLDGSSGIMIDFVANIGASTIPLAAKHPQIRFHCYEPHPEILD